VAFTYFEAGGWGRALMLEARRRRITTFALQHGFIYRHWLNYLHEPDEMAPSPANPADGGFPRPDCTLIFDEFTREHLERQGRFPPERLRVTGSPRLDAVVAAARAFGPAARATLRAQVGAGADTPVVVVAAKFAQLGRAFAAVVEAAGAMPDIRVVIKPHPAESADPYRETSVNASNVVVAPPSAGLGQLTAIASALVTANSTAAIEAMPLGVPALVVALPNNLSPFVEAGVMAGAATPAEVEPALRALLYDREMRQRIVAAQGAFMRRYRIEADGRAAERAAEAILSLVGT
jgi:UDP-N-acetylglucosamine 2-epimerase